MRSRFVFVGLLVPAFAITAACSFPSAGDFIPDVDAGGLLGLLDGGSRSTTTGTDLPDQDAAVSELGDAGRVADVTACTDLCDCDDDGYWKDAGCNPDAGSKVPRKGFGDCDDLDPAYHPNADFTNAKARGPMGDDWNCDGVVTPYYPTSLQCAGLGATGCVPTFGGFVTAPACGETDEFSTCTASGLLACQATPSGTRTQACR